MADIRSLITNLIINWNQDTYILFRIWFLVGLLFVLYLIMCANVTPFSPKSDQSSILNLLDVLSDSILAYILGAMQATSSKNQAFPVLALALVSYRSTFNTLSRYGTYAELRNMLKLLAVAYMNVTRGSWRTPFWIFWSSLVLKSLNRILARYQVSKSLWHGKSSELLQEYMDAITPDRCDPETMEGYAYLVYGEAERNKKTGHSLYNLRSLVTLDKVWQYDRPLLRCINKQGNNMKDLCLAVALSRLLRCRVEGAALYLGSVSTIRKLIYSKILTDAAEGVPADNADMVLVNDAEKAFGTLGMDLSFLNDYIHTSFPMVFGEGSFLSLSFTLLQSVVRYSMAVWLFIDGVHRGIKQNKIHESYHLDYRFTVMAISFVMGVDLWEVIMYILSDWTTLMFICKYLNGGKIFRHLIFSWGRNIFNSHRKPCVRTRTGQYIFLQSFNYSPWKWKPMHKLSMGVVASKGNGTKLSDAIKLPEMVKAKVFEALCGLRSKNFEGHCLPIDLISLCANDHEANQHWCECLQLPTCSQVILVWHIATSLCEMKLAEDCGMDLSKQELIMDEKAIDDDLRSHYTVANSLSRYCAYLIVSKPDLLPDTILVPKLILQKTVSRAREMLKDCDSLQSIYNKLLTLAQEESIVQDSHHRKLSINVVQRGAILGKKLIEDEHHWELLAKVWVNLLVHIAPSTNAQAHTKYLEFGGEFITLVWALFCHCGIEKSELWQENPTSRNCPPGSSQQNNGVAPTSQAQEAVASAPRAAQPHDGNASDLEGVGASIIVDVMETTPTPPGPAIP